MILNVVIRLCAVMCGLDPPPKERLDRYWLNSRKPSHYAL